MIKSSGHFIEDKYSKYDQPLKEPSPDSKVNITDSDSQIMSTTNGWIQGYNAQIVVSEDQYILAAMLSDEQNDKNLLIPMLDEVEELFSAAQTSLLPHSLLADAGYYSYLNVLAENEYDINFIIPPSKREILRNIRMMMEMYPEWKKYVI